MQFETPPNPRLKPGIPLQLQRYAAYQQKGLRRQVARTVNADSEDHYPVEWQVTYEYPLEFSEEYRVKNTIKLAQRLV